MVAWGQGLQTLLQTGRAEPVVEAIGRSAKARGQQWAAGGRVGPVPALGRLGKALDAFSADLSTVRTGDLVGPDGSARRLVDMIRTIEDEVRVALPPLHPMLDQVVEMAAPLGAASLGDEGEQEVLRALGALYLKLERLQEAITISREARISRYAEPAGQRPGRTGHAVDGKQWEEARDAAEGRWRDHDGGARSLALVRNTVNHGGFGAQPLPASAVRAQVTEQVGRIGALVTMPLEDPDSGGGE